MPETAYSRDAMDIDESVGSGLQCSGELEDLFPTSPEILAGPVSEAENSLPSQNTGSVQGNCAGGSSTEFPSFQQDQVAPFTFDSVLAQIFHEDNGFAMELPSTSFQLSDENFAQIEEFMREMENTPGFNFPPSNFILSPLPPSPPSLPFNPISDTTELSPNDAAIGGDGLATLVESLRALNIQGGPVSLYSSIRVPPPPPPPPSSQLSKLDDKELKVTQLPATDSSGIAPSLLFSAPEKLPRYQLDLRRAMICQMLGINQS